MKTVGVLFDVSGSMREKYNYMNEANEIKKSNELINILKNLGKNNKINVFSILYGLYDEPYIIDFIHLLKISNNNLKELKSKDEKSQIYRNKIIDYLSKDQNGNERYCNIRNYIFSDEGPSEKICEFICNAMEEDRFLIDDIYNSLPKEVTEQKENAALNKKIFFGKGAGVVASNAIGILASFIPIAGPIIGPIIMVSGMASSNLVVNHKVKNSEKEETIKAINNSMKKCINVLSDKIMNQYKENENENYNIIEGQKLYELIEKITEKIVIPKGKTINIIDIFQNYIYGDTPLYTSCLKAFSIFEKIKSNKRILLIISDGLLNDIDDIETAKNNINEKKDNLELITVCIYLNNSEVSNEKTFYNAIQSNFDEGAKFLFNISSKIDYHNNIFKYFIKKDWNFPLNGVGNLFAEINNSKDLNNFVGILNESLEYEGIEKINTIIGDSLLDKIIDENYIKQFISEDQGNNPLCWLYSLSSVIYLASARVFGRKIEKFEYIMKKVQNLKEKYLGEQSVTAKYYFEIVVRILRDFKLRAKIITPIEAKIAVMKGRPCLCYFSLREERWNNFREFFAKSPKGILTQKILKGNNICDTKKPPSLHAVVFISIEENCLKFLNSWGREWGDEGYFRLEKEDVIKNLYFIDVFWEEKDLDKKEIDTYNNNYLSFIKQASNYLSIDNYDIKKKLLEKKECPGCKEKLFLENFDLKLNQRRNKNDNTDNRKLKIECLKCNHIFEDDEITTLLYLYNICN